MGHERLLNLGGVHVLAARHDHVLRSIDEEQEALGVDPADVAGPVPAVAEHGGGLLGLVPIAGHDVVAAHDDLAALSCGQVIAIGIDDGDPAAEHRLAA